MKNFRKTTSNSAKKRRLTVAVLSASALALAACSGGDEAAGEETYTIQIADYFPTSHIMAEELVVPWQEKVVELTDGRVEFEYYPSGQLVEVNELYSAMQSGIVDMVALSPTVSARAELPLTGITGMPGIEMPDSNAETSQAYTELLTEILYEEEWKDAGVRPLLGASVGDYQMINSGAPIADQADWQGSVIRSTGGMLDVMISQNGGSPTAMGATEIYEALERSTVDSAIAGGESVTQYGWEEVANSMSTNAQLGFGAVALAITEEKWESLPEDIQAALEEASAQVLESYGAASDQERESAFAALENVMELYEFTGEDFASLQESNEIAAQRWIDEQESAGRPGQKIYDAWVQATQR